MKDELLGRIVGISRPHRLDPSQIDAGDPLDSERTVWVRITYHSPAVFRGKCIHTGNEYGGQPEIIHTVMPEGYTPGDQRDFVVGDSVVLDDDPDAIIPAGTYSISKINPDGSFHVGGNTAVWPTRVVASTKA